jgi:cyclic pyranopterin phosphate synthase
MPADGVPLQPAHHLLQTDELLHLATFFSQAGVNKFRLTGGEPTLRSDLVNIVQGLSDLEPRQIGMTTNGVALASKVPSLVDAGLDSINVSLDTLQSDKWESLTRRPVTYLHKVLDSLEACYEHMPKASQIKINCVLQRDVNTDEVADFISMGIDRFPGIAVRFIEYMPFTDNGWELDKLVPYREVLDSLNEQQQHAWQLDKVPQTDPHDTTQWYKAWYDEERFVNLGFITSMSRPFCAGCNRLRLSADGQLKVCLFGSTIHPHPAHLPSLWSLRDALRVGQLDDAQLGKLVYAALQTKEKALGGHASPQMIHEHARENKPMTLIGG